MTSTARIPGAWASLAPDRTLARTPTELARALSAHPEADSVGAALERVAAALHESFPDNVFGDLDALAGSLARRESGRAIEASAARIVGLQQLYGASSSIRFRYAHDFLYGYDWARWWQRDPAARADIGPFDDPFLGYLEERGRELLGLIAADDAKYPTLRHARSRNPFPFRREPADERLLLTALAREGNVPVAAWQTSPPLDAGRPFSALREARARALGLGL
jgi:hypothetical protein